MGGTSFAQAKILKDSQGLGYIMYSAPLQIRKNKELKPKHV